MYARSLHALRRFAVVLAFVAAGAAAPQVALADPPEGPKSSSEGDVTSYRFEDELVRGGSSSPELEILVARRRNERESLVRVRTHFVPELLKSAEDL